MMQPARGSFETSRLPKATNSLRVWAGVSLLGVVLFAGVTAQAAPKLAAPSGVAGIGTGMAPGQDKRAWMELGLHTRSEVTTFSPVFGFGLFIAPAVEAEAILPLSYSSVDFNNNFGADFSESESSLFNPYLGVNWLEGSLGERLRFSAGLTLPVGSVPNDAPFAELAAHGLNVATAEGIRGRQDPFLWADDTLTVLGRVRYERGRQTVMSFEGTPMIFIPTADGDTRDTDVGVLPAVEFGTYLNPRTLVGGRLSFFWLISGGSDTDNAQLALTPFIRHQFGTWFVHSRLTVNLDGPYGFAFESDGVWGLILGGGASF